METISGSERKSIFQTIDKKSDNIITVSLVLYFVFGLFLATFYSTWSVALGVGGLCLVIYFSTKVLLPEWRLYQYLLSCILAIFSAQFIYQMHGMFEMHFFVFVGSTLLITYQNWRLQIPLLLLVVIHHGLFAYLQYAGNNEIYFTQLSYMDLQTFIMHGFLAAVIVGICGYWAYDLEQKTISQTRATHALESKMKSIDASIRFAGAISSGNLDVRPDFQEDSDALGQALLKMQQNLLAASEKEKKEKFASFGMSRVAEIVTTSGQEVGKLADDFVSMIVKYAGANQGAMFLSDKKDGEDFLALQACYAYDRKKYLDKNIAPGEGLVGQCYLERDVIFLKEVPRNFVKITSGLGEATPTSILLIPMMTREEIIGVIELASFTEFEDYQIDFLKKACESVAGSIVSNRVTETVKKLLRESQMQGEAMRAQEEELRQNIEELQATQEAMRRRENERHLDARLRTNGAAQMVNVVL